MQLQYNFHFVLRDRLRGALSQDHATPAARSLYLLVDFKELCWADLLLVQVEAHLLPRPR